MTLAQTGATPADAAQPERDRLRSDAQHNRERILAVARETLADSRDVSLNSIAKKAGVGPGTLYRHFPSREALVLAVYREDVRSLTDSPADLLAQHEPLRALRLWLDRLAICVMTNRNLAEALQSATGDSLAGGPGGRVAAAAAQLVAACQEDGSITLDVEAREAILLISFLWRIESGPHAADRVARLLDVIMSGMQAGAPRSSSRANKRRPARPPLWLRRRLSLGSLSMHRSR